jgi:hypothetical protein
MCLRLLFLFPFLFAQAILFSQQTSLLYRIVPPQGAAASYILCTAQLPGIEKFDIEFPAAEVMDKVSTVAFYWLPDENEKQYLPSLMKLSNDSTLKGYFTREDRIRFELMVRDKLKDNIDNYVGIKPLYILEKFRAKDFGEGASYQQQALFNIAIEKTKPTLSLLNAREINEHIDEMDFETQAEVMIHYVNNANTYLIADEKLLRSYVSQNLQEFSVLFSNATHDAYENFMINNLNDLLAQRIDAVSNQLTVLFILNAERIAGNRGILQNLIAKGYSVSPEPFNLKAKNNDAPANMSNMPDTIAADNFPELKQIQLNPGMENSSPKIQVIHLNDTSKTLFNNYHAYVDPYGDLFDYASADTSFLDYWYMMKGIEASFSVKVPVKLNWEETTTETLNGPIKSYVYQTNHAKSDLYYSIGYTIYPPTFDAGNKNDFYNDFIYRSVRKLNGELISQRIISTPEYTGREFVIRVADSVFIRSKLILQKNILYQLLTGGPKNNAYSSYAEAFFSSFQTSANNANNWFYFQHSSFTAYFPTAPGQTSQTYSTASGPLIVETFKSEDYKEGVSYFVSINTYPDEYDMKSKTAFYNDLILTAERQYVGRASEIKNVRKDKIKGRYVELHLMNNKIYRMYFFVDDNKVYQYLAGGNPAAVTAFNVQRFFDSITFVKD